MIQISTSLCLSLPLSLSRPHTISSSPRHPVPPSVLRAHPAPPVPPGPPGGPARSTGAPCLPRARPAAPLARSSQPAVVPPHVPMHALPRPIPARGGAAARVARARGANPGRGGRLDAEPRCGAGGGGAPPPCLMPRPELDIDFNAGDPSHQGWAPGLG